ncbi:MAG TPA: DNA polymerase I [Burkholderiaceae bacterium]|nr:DNA polymerase I [Burkholderiaceae bacterium]
MTEKTLLLVDGSSFLYRAFHALPDMRSPSAEPTGAVYGVVAMLRRLRADSKLNEGADHGAVVFDAPGKTFRDDWFPEYKANRAKMPDDLALQIPVIHDLVRAMGWPLLMLPGIEADDVIGTLAHQALALGMKTVIATGDKDLAQLVDHHTVLINTMTAQGGQPERLDPAAVLAKFGVPPERIVDWLSLVGDAVDNVPGVDKVGPKTAVKWLEQYGSLDGVIAHADKISGVVGNNLRRALDWLPTARKLVTVLTDCDLSGHMGSIEQSLPLRDEDPAALRELFKRCGFRTWLRDLDDAAQGATGQRAVSAFNGTAGEAPDASAAPEQPGGEPIGEPVYELVADHAALQAWIERIGAAELVSIDTETTSLDPMAAHVIGISLSTEPGHGCYIPLAHAYAGVPEQLGREEVLAALRPWLENPAARKVGQNLKYDAHVFENHGIRLAGIAHDTLLQSYVIEAHRTHDMDSLASRHLNRRTITYDEVTGKGAARIGFDQVSLEQATRYAAEDAEVTMHLHRTLWPRIQADPGLRHVYENIEMPALRVLQHMERTGVLIDARLLHIQSEELGRKLMALEAQVHEAAGQPFNLGSPKQLGEILFERQGLPVVKKTPSGAPSTDEEVLSKLAEDYPLPRLLLEWRGLSKIKSTYTDKLPRSVNPATGRVHTQFSQAVAVTGRLASSEPNLQNIPIRTPEGRRIREAFIAPPGHCLVSADYSQIELRIMAHLSDDEGLLSAFAQGLDVHRATAAEIFSLAPEAVSSEQRRYAKVINFGLIYGMSAFGLAANLGIERSAASSYIERYFTRYPGVRRYMDDTKRRAKEQGYVETVFGRRLWLPEINSAQKQRRDGAERAAINAPMQGTAADLIKMAMIAVQQWIEAEAAPARLVLQVHDELVLEVPLAELEPVRERLRGLMTGIAALKVPLEVEVGAGPNWDQAH